MKVTNKMQLYRLIYFYLPALHVSGDVLPTIRSTRLYLQYLVVFTQVAAGWLAATWVITTRYCKYSLVLLMVSKNIAQNM